MLKLLPFIFLLFRLKGLACASANLNTSTVKPANQSTNNPKLNSTVTLNLTIKHGKINTPSYVNISKIRSNITFLDGSKVATNFTFNKNKNCSGWCISVSDKTVAWEENNKTNVVHFENPERDINLAINTDGKQQQRFKSVKNLIDKYPYYPVRVAMNIFSDRHGYEDRDNNNKMKARFLKLFDKNLIQVPTDTFFPYTRNAIKELVEESGYVYSPRTRIKYPEGKTSEVVPWIPIPTALEKENDESKEKFSNRYFEEIPYLYYQNEKSNRKTNYIIYPGDVTNLRRMNNKIMSNKSSKLLKKANPNKLRRSKISKMLPPTAPVDISNKILLVNAQDFVSRDAIQRSNYIDQDHLSTISRILGINDDLPIFNSPNNDVDDIVGGMKVTKDAGTLLLGTSKAARTKLSRWLVGKGRTLGLKDNNNGILIQNDNKSRPDTINKLLRSMLHTYQYGGAEIPSGNKLAGRRCFICTIE